MERSWGAAALAMLLVAVIFVASGCAPNHPKQAQAVAGGPVARIGAALSLTGAARMTGIAQRSGIRLAQDEINASGMFGKTRLDVVVEDDASDREQAAAVFQRFIEDSHVVAILGPTLSDTAQTVDPIAQQAAVPVLAISNSASGITQIGNFIFRASLSESQLTPQVIRAVRSHMKLHRAALLYSDTDPNRSGSHGFKTGLENAGVHVVAEQTFAKDQTDFSSQLEDIATAQPDALFVTAPSSTAATILVQTRQAGLQKLPIIGSSAFNSDAVLRSAGDAAEGLIVGSGWTLGGPSARNQQFVQSYRQRYGVDPDQVAAQAYSGVYILANALKAANTVSDARAVRDALEQTRDLATPLGSFSFNDAHDPDYAATVQVVHLGRFQPYE
jgi:branched-chain amino acid transport system substrate-binding protein